MSAGEHLSKQHHGLEKLCVVLPPDAWHGFENEWIWGERLGPDTFALRNVPFYAKGLSYDDHVRVEDRDGALVIAEVTRRGGHSTYRLIAKNGRHAPEIRQVLDQLLQLGCELEPATDRLVAVDVAPAADVYAVYGVLTKGEAAGALDFDEGHCGHPLRVADADPREGSQ